MLTLHHPNDKMMHVKRTTYALMLRNDEIIKLSQEIKQIIRNLQEENIKKSMLTDEWAKIFQGIKKEYQLLNNKKRQLEDFVRKQEGQNQKIKHEKQIKEGAKLYSKLTALHKRKKRKCIM